MKRGREGPITTSTAISRPEVMPRQPWSPPSRTQGGIAASSDAFVLALLGKEDVAVYDASLSEWAADPALPMERG